MTHKLCDTNFMVEYEFIEYETLRSVSQMFCQEVVLSVLGDFVTERLFLKGLK